MTEENKPTIRKIVFASLLFIIVLLSLSLIREKREYNALMEEYTSQLDLNWILQQELIK